MSTSCEQCKVVFFSGIIGAETSKVCKPCPYGYFNTQEGQSTCLECPSGSICSLYNVKPQVSSGPLSMLSIQPDLIEYKTELFSKISKNIYIIAGILVVVCILLLLIFSNSRQFLRNIDMYT